MAGRATTMFFWKWHNEAVRAMATVYIGAGRMYRKIGITFKKLWFINIYEKSVLYLNSSRISDMQPIDPVRFKYYQWIECKVWQYKCNIAACMTHQLSPNNQNISLTPPPKSKFNFVGRNEFYFQVHCELKHRLFLADILQL